MCKENQNEGNVTVELNTRNTSNFRTNNRKTSDFTLKANTSGEAPSAQSIKAAARPKPIAKEDEE